ncbi:MAG: hypothetical protein WCJ74_00795 [bacterium]
MNMFLKRIVNTVVTASIFLFVIYFLAETILSKIFWLLELEGPSVYDLPATWHWFLGITFFTLMAVGIVFCGFCILEILITGNGILWKRVEGEDFEYSMNQKIFYVRNGDKFIWRLDPVFKGRRPICPFI